MEIHLSRFKFAHFLFNNTDSAWLWLILRVYVGYEWLIAGYEKITSPVWTGSQAGVAVSGFLKSALLKTAGAHPDVTSIYAWFVEHIALPNTIVFSYLVAYGEVLVGVALIIGFFVGISAFFGAVMNFNYLFAGTVSINPYLALIQIFLILAWRVAGWYGADRKVLRFFHRH